MKKYIIFILMAFIIAIASCTDSSPAKEKKKESIKALNEGKLSYAQAVRIMRFYNIQEGKFTSNKHRYKIFIDGAGRSSIMGTTHDPDCPHCFILYD